MLLFYLLSLFLHSILAYLLLSRVQVDPNKIATPKAAAGKDNNLGLILFLVILTPGVRTFFISLMIYDILYKGEQL